MLYMVAYAIVLLIAVTLLGLIMGSFIGAMTWRMYTKRDWVRGRSECEHCHHQLAAPDLVPVLSYVCLHGRCRYCRKPIGRTAIILELITGLTFLLAALLYPSMLAGQWVPPLIGLAGLDAVAALGLGLLLVVMVLLIALASYDARWHLLPNKLVAPLVVVSLAYSAVTGLWIGQLGAGEWLLNICLGMLPITGVYGVLYLISHGRWIGLGDVKLGVAIGLLIPWWGGIIVLFLSNLLGSLVALPSLVRHRLHGDSQIPFGPYLIIATYLMLIFGWVAKSILLVL